MKSLVKHVQNVNALHGLWDRGGCIVVGVSGGPDSMCLLDVMAKIAKKENLMVIVAHVNYGLRGADSDKDQKLVEKTAEKYGFACEVKVCAEDIAHNENAWRTLRYEFFDEVRGRHDADVVAVAHNKNDQAETLLLHLLRGSGLAGLSGMQVCSSRGVTRPLLAVSRQDILEYCEKNDINYRTDASNESDVHMRNNIRNNLLPYLQEKYNPQIIDVLAGAALTIADDYAMVREKITVFWQYDDAKNTISFDATCFEQEHVAAQRLSIRMMIERLCGDTVNIEKGFVDELRKAVMSTKSKTQKVQGKDLKMLKKGDKVELVLCRHSA